MQTVINILKMEGLIARFVVDDFDIVCAVGIEQIHAVDFTIENQTAAIL